MARVEATPLGPGAAWVWISRGRSWSAAGGARSWAPLSLCALDGGSLSLAAHTVAAVRAMGCWALLLLPLLSLGASTTTRPRLKTLGSPLLSTHPTPDPASSYSVFYFQQKVSGGWGVRVLGPTSQPSRTLLVCYSLMEHHCPLQNSDSDT